MSGLLFLPTYVSRSLDRQGHGLPQNVIIVKMAARYCNYKPLPMMTAYKTMEFDIKTFSNACNQYRNEITLPLHTHLSDNDVQYVVYKISLK